VADKFLSRQEAAELLQEHGFPTTPTSLAVKASRGGGPPYHRFGRQAIYAPSEVLAWAHAKVATAAATASEHRAQEVEAAE
jgi:hypothetical protein